MRCNIIKFKNLISSNINFFFVLELVVLFMLNGMCVIVMCYLKYCYLIIIIK